MFKQMSKAMFQLNSERALLDGIERKNGETLYQNYEKAIQLGLVDEDVNADLQAYEKQGVSIFGLDASGKKVLLTPEQFKQKYREAGSVLNAEGEDINEVGFGKSSGGIYYKQA